MKKASFPYLTYIDGESSTFYEDGIFKRARTHPMYLPATNLNRKLRAKFPRGYLKRRYKHMCIDFCKRSN